MAWTEGLRVQPGQGPTWPREELMGKASPAFPAPPRGQSLGKPSNEACRPTTERLAEERQSTP